MIERLTAKITRKERVAVYKERANYYRKRAIIETIQNGVLDFLDDKTEGVELIHPANTVSIDLPNQEEHLEFAFDKNGLAFARVKDGKYYPIKIEKSQEMLKIAERYDKDAKSTLRRIFIAPGESLDDAVFKLAVSANNLNDTVTEMLIKFHEILSERTSDDEINQEKSGAGFLLSAAAKHSA